MRKSSFFENPIAFHKRHHTVFMIAETGILTAAIVILTFLCQKTVYVIQQEEHIILEEGIWKLSATGYGFFQILPLITSLSLLIFIFAVLFVRDKKGDPILAKKMSHWLFYVSVVALVLDLITRFFELGSCFSNVKIGTEVVMDRSFGQTFIVVARALCCLDFYVWRSEFGLERFYGSRDVYR